MLRKVMENYYLHILKEGLSKKQKLNPAYSLRAYARDTKVHPATLSQVLKGRRALPLKDSQSVIDCLRLSPKQRTLFMDSLLRSKCHLDSIAIPNDERFLLDESHFKVIAEWEHYAVLSLFDLSDFRVTPTTIIRKLGITPIRAEVILHNLKASGMIREEKGVLKKFHSKFRTTEDVKNPALQLSHQETLSIASKKLTEVPVELRDFSSLNVALDMEKLCEAKVIIREFRQKMEALLIAGKKTEVYHLSIQFFPLTELHKKPLLKPKPKIASSTKKQTGDLK